MPVPAHVPDELVRDIDLDKKGTVEELHAHLDALREEGRAFWLRESMGGNPYGAWLFTRAEDVQAVLQQPDLFSSDFGGMMIPLFLDPPEHTKYRRLLNPLFAPGVVARMEDSIRVRARALVSSLAPQGSCDFVSSVSVEYPTRVFTSWFGLPEERTADFVDLASTLIHHADDEARRAAALAGTFTVIGDLIAERRAAPADDLISDIIALELDGRPLRDDELMRIGMLLFFAGLDTVAAALSFSFWHLAQTPSHRRVIVDGSVPLQQVVEELLRRHSFVSPPRLVARDASFAGVQVRKGDPVVVSLPLASRDPSTCPHASDVDLERADVRHPAFGLGPHRCLGSHLARLEMRVALEEWHAAIPDYELAGDVSAYSGVVMGLSTLPLRWTT
ncbi:MAG TPA: cytochrome P450 [Acidimicrobiales bacterium]|nr:cytochrome P450 [Acidimicrobiales bacterium]